MFIKVAWWKKRLRSHHTANLNFLFLSLFVYLLKNCSSQFFSNWKSAEPVFCSEELSCLPYKNQNKSLTLSFGEGKFKFAVLWGLFTKPFFHCPGPPLNITNLWKYSEKTQIPCFQNWCCDTRNHQKSIPRLHSLYYSSQTPNCNGFRQNFGSWWRKSYGV